MSLAGTENTGLCASRLGARLASADDDGLNPRLGYLICHAACNSPGMTQLRKQLAQMSLRRRVLSMIPVAALALGFAISVYVVLTMPM